MDNGINNREGSAKPSFGGQGGRVGPFFTTYKSPLAVTLAIIIMAGLFAYSKMHVALFPEITFPKIKIIADAGLQPVDKMMVTVTPVSYTHLTLPTNREV